MITRSHRACCLIALVLLNMLHLSSSNSHGSQVRRRSPIAHRQSSLASIPEDALLNATTFTQQEVFPHSTIQQQPHYSQGPIHRVRYSSYGTEIDIDIARPQPGMIILAVVVLNVVILVLTIAMVFAMGA